MVVYNFSNRTDFLGNRYLIINFSNKNKLKRPKWTSKSIRETLFNLIKWRQGKASKDSVKKISDSKFKKNFCQLMTKAMNSIK